MEGKTEQTGLVEYMGQIHDWTVYCVVVKLKLPVWPPEIAGTPTFEHVAQIDKYQVHEEHVVFKDPTGLNEEKS